MNGALPDTLAQIVSRLGVLTPKAYELMKHKMYLMARAEAWAGGVATILLGILTLVLIYKGIEDRYNGFEYGLPAFFTGFFACMAAVLWISGAIGMQTVEADAIARLISLVR